jgi:hypothetical protein
LLLLTIAAIEGLYFRRWLGTAIFVLLAALWWLLSPWYNKRSSRKFLDRFYSEGRPDRFFGPHYLEIDGDILVAKGPYGESRVPLSSVERFEIGAGHAFVYLDSVRAIVIPRNSVTSGSYSEFLSRLQDEVRGVA